MGKDSPGIGVYNNDVSKIKAKIPLISFGSASTNRVPLKNDKPFLNIHKKDGPLPHFYGDAMSPEKLKKS